LDTAPTLLFFHLVICFDENVRLIFVFLCFYCCVSLSRLDEHEIEKRFESQKGFFLLPTVIVSVVQFLILLCLLLYAKGFSKCFAIGIIFSVYSIVGKRELM